jgi:hypothetical protein
LTTEVDNTSGLLALVRSHELDDDVVFIGDYQRTILELSCMALGAQRVLRDYVQEGILDEAATHHLGSIQKCAQVALQWINAEVKKHSDDTIPKFIWEQLPKG